MKLSMGMVTLRVKDLNAQVAFYQSALGLQLRERLANRAVLGTGSDDLLTLIEAPDARKIPGTAGLYHFALRVPTRTDLARVLMHLAQTRTPLQGVSDHYVSEAIYLADIEGNGIEIYHDRPMATWFNEGLLNMGTVALDVDDLFSELTDDEAATFEMMPDGTDMGHVHLHVGAVPESEAFYRAVFLSYDRYHHHLGANVWGGRRPTEPGSIGLDHLVIKVHDAAVYEGMRQRLTGTAALQTDYGNRMLVADPSGIQLSIVHVPTQGE
jgi:catechol 2,3-dioxygenase